MKELLSLCPEKLHCPVLLETLIYIVRKLNIHPVLFFGHLNHITMWQTNKQSSKILNQAILE